MEAGQPVAGTRCADVVRDTAALYPCAMVAPVLIAKAPEDVVLLPGFANRHGLVAGATGTGKTVTLRVLAEGFSRIGVPVFLADVKGDLSGLARPGGDAPAVVERAKRSGLPLQPEALPDRLPGRVRRGGPPAAGHHLRDRSDPACRACSA